MGKKPSTTRVSVIILLSVLFFSFNIRKHDPGYSNTILIEQVDGSWVLQIRSALIAFEYEVHTNYGKDSYKSPEEFNALVIQHLIKNLSIKINKKHVLSFENGYVKLGHETTAVFEVIGIPKNITKVFFTNSSFKDVYNNQNALIILKKGFEKKQFFLNEGNKYAVELKVSTNQFVQQ